MPITQFEGKALVFNNGVVDVKQGDTSLVDSEKVAHIPEGNVKIDELTIIKNADNELEVPFDNQTIYRDSDGFIKARGGSGSVEVGYPDNGEVTANGTFTYHEPTSGGASWSGTVDASVEPTAVDFGIALFGWSDEWPHPWTERVMGQNSSVELVARTANNSRSFKVISAAGYADGQENSVTLELEPNFEYYNNWELNIYDNGFNLYTEETETFTDNIVQFRLNYADTSTLKQLQNGHLVNDPMDLSDINNSINRIDNSVSDLNTALESKQDTLTAGQNITIQNNVISATGGVTIQHYPNAVINIPCNVETKKESQVEITLTQEQYNSIITACGGANVKRHNTAGGSYWYDDSNWFDSESDCYIDVTYTNDWEEPPVVHHAIIPITAMGMITFNDEPIFVFQEQYAAYPNNGTIGAPQLSANDGYKLYLATVDNGSIITNVKFVLRDIPTIVL